MGSQPPSRRGEQARCGVHSDRRDEHQPRSRRAATGDPLALHRGRSACPARAAPGRLGGPDGRTRGSVKRHRLVWLPIPAHEPYKWTVVAEEPCLVALAETHPRASDPELAFEDPLDEPFRALPESAGPLRDYWLAIDQRGGKPPVIGAIIASPDETYEALVDGRGICLIAQGNAPSLMRGGVVTRPVDGVPSCTLALAWRAGCANPLIRAYADAATQVVQHLDRSQPAGPSSKQTQRDAPTELLQARAAEHRAHLR